MKRKTIHVISTILIFALIITSLSGCGEQSRVEKLIARFERSYQEIDIDAMLDCIDPRYSKMVRGFYGILGGAMGVDIDSMTDLLYGVIGFSYYAMDDEARSELNTSLDMFKSTRIKPKRFVFNDDNDECVVTADLSMIVGGEKYYEEVTITCLLYDGEWYLAAE